MGNPVLCHILLGILLTGSQINSVIAAPITSDIAADEWEYYYDCKSETTSSSTGHVTRTVLESNNGEVFVPYTTLTSSVPYTTNGMTDYSTTVITEYSSTSTYPIQTSSTAKSSSIAPASAYLGPVLSTKEPDTSSYTLSATSQLTSLSSSAVQTASTTVRAQVSGTVMSSLETAGETSAQPFATSVASASMLISLINTSSTSLAKPNITTTATALSVDDIFVAFETGAPPPQVEQRSDHPVPTLGIAAQTKKLETNKFYAGFFLGSQASTAFTHPYSVAWAKGSGATDSYGLAVSHIERSQLAFGPGSPAEYFINPIGLQSLILSATELNTTTNLTTDSLDAFSVNVNLLPSADKAPVITFPLVQGMGFVTAVYSNSTPCIESSISFLSVDYEGLVASGSTYKYRANLADGTTWLFYVTTAQNGYPVNEFTLKNPRLIQGASGFQGFIQVAKVPLKGCTDGEATYDNAAGAYPVSATISGSVLGTTGSYSLTWTKQGVANRTLLMFALPHHIEILDSKSATVTDLKLETTTKGNATAVIADSWCLTEPDLPIEMGFAPWSPSLGSVDNVSDDAAKLIEQAGENELSQDMGAQSNLDSMYYSGKALAKFAAVVYAVHDVAGNATLAISGLEKLKDALSVFVENTQIYPLVYDSVWGGAVSSGTYQTDDSGLDFGNTYYNDHHFHYGYFVYAAAVIGYLDPSWLDEGTNKAWVNMLVRDYATPVTDDEYFPFSRSFDWFHGHSWAKGLFESNDGKDQESSSEDTMSIFGIKMWGRTINDTVMEARGNVMLAMQARSLQNYFLYTSDNTVEPSSIIGNKVSGVMFENKIDHTTYFGSKTEYIEGIHMLPLMPFSAFTRTQQFVTEEWDTYFSNGRADVDGGWRGILYANLAIIDGNSSYAFFSDADFNSEYLDGGASLTWYLTYSAGLGGSSTWSPTSSKRSEIEAMQADQEMIAEARGQAQVKAHVAAHKRKRHVHSWGEKSKDGE